MDDGELNCVAGKVKQLWDEREKDIQEEKLIKEGVRESIYRLTILLTALFGSVLIASIWTIIVGVVAYYEGFGYPALIMTVFYFQTYLISFYIIYRIGEKTASTQLTP